MRRRPLKRRITALRKYAAGVHIPAPNGHVNNNTLLARQSPGKEASASAHLAPEPPPPRETSIIRSNITAKSLLDIVSFQNIHPHKEPVVLLERIESSRVALAPVAAAPLGSPTVLQNGTATDVLNPQASTSSPPAAPVAEQSTYLTRSRTLKNVKAKTRHVINKSKIATRSSSLGTKRVNDRRQTSIAKRRTVSSYDTEDETPLKFLKTRTGRRRQSQSSALGDNQRAMPPTKSAKGTMVRKRRPQRALSDAERRVLRNRIIGAHRSKQATETSSSSECELGQVKPPLAPMIKIINTFSMMNYDNLLDSDKKLEVKSEDNISAVYRTGGVLENIIFEEDKTNVYGTGEVAENLLDEEVSKVNSHAAIEEIAVQQKPQTDVGENGPLTSYYGRTGISQWIDTAQPPAPGPAREAHRRHSCAARRYASAYDAFRAPKDVKLTYCQVCTRCKYMHSVFTCTDLSGTPPLCMSPTLTDVYDFSNEENDLHFIFKRLASGTPRLPQLPALANSNELGVPVFHKPELISLKLKCDRDGTENVTAPVMTVGIQNASDSNLLEAEPSSASDIAQKSYAPRPEQHNPSTQTEMNSKAVIKKRSRPTVRTINRLAVARRHLSGNKGPTRKIIKKRKMRKISDKSPVTQQMSLVTTSKLALSILKTPQVVLTPYDALPTYVAPHSNDSKQAQNNNLNVLTSSSSPNTEDASRKDKEPNAVARSIRSVAQVLASRVTEPVKKVPISKTRPISKMRPRTRKTAALKSNELKMKSISLESKVSPTMSAAKVVSTTQNMSSEPKCNEIKFNIPMPKLAKKDQPKAGSSLNKNTMPVARFSNVALDGKTQDELDSRTAPDLNNFPFFKAVSSYNASTRPIPETDGRATPSVSSSILPISSNKLVPAPTFCPTEEEFTDPIAFFEKVQAQVAKFGICKVKPPHSFSQSCSLDEIKKFRVTNQYLGSMYNRWGPATRELAAIKAYLATQNVVFDKPPLHDGIEINLPLLYHVVQRLGGLKQVIEKKRWARVAEEMHISKDARNTEKILDKIYVKYLLPYDTLSSFERQRILAEVEKCWNKRNTRMMELSLEPLRRQQRLLEDCTAHSEEENADDPQEVANAVASAEDCVSVGRPLQTERFKKIAKTALNMYFPYGTPDVDEVEAKYWNLVLHRTAHVCVYSASIDTTEYGHGISNKSSEDNKKSSKKSANWNLKSVISNPRNVLRSLGSVVGVTAPTMHLGMVFSTSCWHRDPHGLPWLEHMHRGPPKIWYGIPDAQSASFRLAVERLCPTSCQNKSIWLPSDITMIPPKLLNDTGVSMSRLVQHPGELVFVLPKAYSCSIATGFTVSESVYFATDPWLDMVPDIFRELRLSCEPATFSLDHLLVKMASDARLPPERRAKVCSMFSELVDKEMTNRSALWKKGIPVREQAHKSRKVTKGGKSSQSYDLFDECEVCRTTLYLSKVQGVTSKGSSWCLEDTLAARKLDAVAHRIEMVLYFSNKKLGDLKSALQSRCGTSQ